MPIRLPSAFLLLNNGLSLADMKVSLQQRVDTSRQLTRCVIDNEDNVLIITPTKNAGVIGRVKDIVMEHVPTDVSCDFWLVPLYCFLIRISRTLDPILCTSSGHSDSSFPSRGHSSRSGCR